MGMSFLILYMPNSIAETEKCTRISHAHVNLQLNDDNSIF